MVPAVTAAALAERQLAAYNAHDADAFAACYAEDVEVRRLPGGEAVATGRGDLRRVYADLFRRLPGRRAALVHRIACGGFVVDLESVTDGPGAPPRAALAIYQEEGGFLRRVWFPPAVEGPPAAGPASGTAPASGAAMPAGAGRAAPAGPRTPGRVVPARGSRARRRGKGEPGARGGA